MERTNPLAGLDKFKPQEKTLEKSVDERAVDKVAEVTGFPSREPTKLTARVRGRRRPLTGRNQQFNVKLTSKTIDKIYQMAELKRISLGELVEMALDALDRVDHQNELPLAK